ncbi:hypothetical protein NPX13_g9451 [Xylaria arbuscula]|uniref:Uncharacterized protein n=1 Tax=Xylaria arbuscula TaxID=114810 RepID=A0A9W8TJ12_9PEZI|nr:hypothetical protein NPX13_g9451 [Xylaria arbuscula]
MPAVNMFPRVRHTDDSPQPYTVVNHNVWSKHRGNEAVSYGFPMQDAAAGILKFPTLCTRGTAETQQHVGIPAATD